MFAIARRVQSSRFLRNVAKLSSGKLAALTIAVVATPIVSRLFSPADYGVAALFIAVATITSNVLALAYERAVIFPKDELKANRVFFLGIAVSAGFAILVFGIIALVALGAPAYFVGSSLGEFMWLVPLGALLMSVNSAMNALCVRRNDYTAIAVADVGNATVMASARIFWGVLIGSSTAGLLAGYFLGTVFAILTCVVRSYTWLKQGGRIPGFSEMKDLAIEFRDYPQFRAPAKIAFAASRKLPVIALGMMFSAEVVGFYAMANRAAGRPLFAVSKSVSDVLLGKTMRLRHADEPLARSLLIVAAVLAVTGIPVFSIMLIFGEELLAWFLGDRWASAGIYVQIMAPYLFTIWVGSFTNTVFETLRLNKTRLKLNTGNLVTRILIFSACAVAGFDIVQTLWSFVVASCLYQAFVYFIAGRAVVRYDRGLKSQSRTADHASDAVGS